MQSSFTLKSVFKNIDWVLFLAIIPILVFGLGALWPLSGDTIFFKKQVISIIIGICIFFLASTTDPRFFRKSSIVLTFYFICVFLLLLLFVFGNFINGAQSWFILGIIWFGMVLASGLSKKHILILTTIGLVIFASLYIFVFAPYQKQRLSNFLNPLADIHGSGYNVLQSTIAVGSGQVIGKGLGFGTQSRLRFLPEYQTDFIFAAYAEEWGFFCVLILLIFY